MRAAGYALLRSLLPPKFNGSKIGRGLVLIDPPYEAQDAEYQAVLAALAETLARWPQATCAVWFPIKQRRTILHFLRKATALPVKSAMTIEFLVRPDDSPLPPQRQRHAAQPAVAVRPGGRPGPWPLRQHLGEPGPAPASIGSKPRMTALHEAVPP